MPNVRLIIAAVTLTASPTLAGSLPYRVLTMDFGGVPHGTIGLPVTWQAPGNALPYRHPLGSLFPPTPDLIDAVPAVRWDDYFMFDPVGRSDGGDPLIEGDGYAGLAPSGSVGLSIGAGSMLGMQYAVGTAQGGRFAGADGRLYFASITLPAAASPPETSGIYIGLMEQGADEAHIRRAKFGPENAVFGSIAEYPMPRVTSRRYYIDWIATAVPASELGANFGPGINYTLYIQQESVELPTPGTAFTMGLALLTATRRRR